MKRVTFYKTAINIFNCLRLKFNLLGDHSLVYRFKILAIILIVLNTGTNVFAQKRYTNTGAVFQQILPENKRVVRGDLVIIGNTSLGVTRMMPNYGTNDNPTINNLITAGTIPNNFEALKASANSSDTFEVNDCNYCSDDNAPEAVKIFNSNNGKNMEYIDIDSDQSTFSSSSARLTINSKCKEIVYAGLYWTAAYPADRVHSSKNYEGAPRKTDWNRIKFKLPNTSEYIDIVAEDNPVNDEGQIIFDQPYVSNNDVFEHNPYLCYKDVTTLLQELHDINGDYTVANIRGTLGKRVFGSYAGWTLVVIYKDESMPSKYLSVFDGTVQVRNNPVEFVINGLQIPPEIPVVKGRIGIGIQDGDIDFQGEHIYINGKEIFNSLNPSKNFFNSTISIPEPTLANPLAATNILTRNPNRVNTYGFDIDMVDVNPGILKNTDTSAIIRLTGEGDTSTLSLLTFAIDMVEPKIELNEVVKNSLGFNIGNEEVNFDDELTYELTFQNKGNDDAKNVKLEVILPQNILFNNPSDLEFPSGISVDSYDPVTRKLTFTISDYLVRKNGSLHTVKIHVKVVPCQQFQMTCTNELSSSAKITYTGNLNTDSFTSFENTLEYSCEPPPPSIFNKITMSGCMSDNQTVVMCKIPTSLSAPYGFEQYIWSNTPGGPDISGNSRTYEVHAFGTYYVRCIAFNNPTADQACLDFNITIEVLSSVTDIDPFLPFANEQIDCTVDGKTIKLTNFYLCKDEPYKVIKPKIPSNAIVTWEISSCEVVQGRNNCPEDVTGCTWSQIPGNNSLTVTTPGRYRMTLSYDGGCENKYYFNVYDIINSEAIPEDIYCETPGKITVNMLGANNNEYEYSLDGNAFQTSTVLEVQKQGTYTVYIRPINGNTSKCPDEIRGIEIKKNDIVLTSEKKNLTFKCHGDNNASVKLTAVNARPGLPFTYELFFNDAKKESISSIQSSFQFDNLEAGSYKATVSNSDGCFKDDNFTVVDPSDIEFTARITKVATCTAAEVTLEPIGGTAPYTVFIEGHNSLGTLKFSDTIIIPKSEKIVMPIQFNEDIFYSFVVTDVNNCKNVPAAGSFRIEPIKVLDVEILPVTNVDCHGNRTGRIEARASGGLGNYRYTLLNNDGQALSFVPTQLPPNSGNFSNLPAGRYQLLVESDDCILEPVPIEITEPDVLSHTKRFEETVCSGVANVRIIIEAIGGTGKIQYAISSRPNQFVDSGIFENIKAGTYEIICKDQNNCTSTEIITIVDPKPIEAMVVTSSIVQQLCYYENTGAFNIEIKNGTPPYSTSLDNQNGPYIPNQVNFNNLAGGKHTVYVHDLYNCEIAVNIVLDPPMILDPKVMVTYECENNEPANKVVVSLDASITDLSLVKFSLDGQGIKQSSAIFKNVAPGSHFIQVEHANGCVEESLRFLVKSPNPPLRVVLELGNMNEIKIIATGGSGIYKTITINNSSSSFVQKYTFYNSGTYTVTVTDSEGCTATDTKPFEFVGLDVPNIFTPNGSGINDGWKPVHQEVYPDILINIYDRYGREVAVLRYEESWDGKYKGKELPTGDYWYVIKLRNTKDDREFVGNVTLYR